MHLTTELDSFSMFYSEHTAQVNTSSMQDD